MRSNTNGECGSVRLSRARKVRRTHHEPMILSKQQLRQEARERRKGLAHAGFAQALAAHAAALQLAPRSLIGGYHALPEEADPALLLQRLVEQGHAIAFPRVAAKDQALEFHSVPQDEILRPGAFGVHEPLSHWPVVIPSVLLVPLLAFDAQGYRLGFGGGYYDRTLARLEGARAIGIAYAGQQVPLLPHEDHDRVLEAVLTEKGLHQMPGIRR